MFLHECLSFNAVNIIFDCVNFYIISISWKGVFSMVRYNIRITYDDANTTKKSLNLYISLGVLYPMMNRTKLLIKL